MATQKSIAGGGLRWQFYDPYDLNPATNFYDFEISPNTMESPHPERQINAMVSTGGQALLFEGSTPVTSWTFGGVLLHRSQYEMLRAWTYERKRRILILDHFGRRHLAVLRKFDAKPTRSIQYYWRHDWTITAMVISTTAPVVGDVYGSGLPWHA